MRQVSQLLGRFLHRVPELRVGPKGHAASGLSVDGGFAEYALHHVGGLHRLAPALTWEDAVLLTTAGTPMYGIQRAGGMVAGDTVVIVGPGPVGLMAVQVARALGAARTIVVGTRPERLAVATAVGADHVIDSTTTDVEAAVRDLTSGRGGDLVIECSGNAAMPESSLRLVRRGGTLLFLAFYSRPVQFDISRANREEVRLVTSRGEGLDAVGRVMQMANAGLISGGNLVTHHVPLDEIQAGFDLLRSKDGDPVKLVFVP